jgi:hypothetical protein
LKNALLERGLPLPTPRTDAPELAPPPALAPGVPPVASAPPQSSPPSEATPPRPPAAIPAEPDLRPRENAEIDRVMDVVERLWHRLVELMATIQRDIQRKG